MFRDALITNQPSKPKENIIHPLPIFKTNLTLIVRHRGYPYDQKQAQKDESSKYYNTIHNDKHLFPSKIK